MSVLLVFLYTAAVALCLLPAALAFQFIRGFGVNVAVVDDFFFVDGFTQFFSGTLSPAYFINLHNGHCLFFGKILMLMLGLLTHFNIIAEMFLSWTFLLFTLCLLIQLAMKILGTKPSTLFLMAPVSFALFSLRPWDVFLNGSVFLNSMTIFFTLLTVTLLFRCANSDKLSKTFIAAICCAFIATFSGSASGLIIWPVGFLQLAQIQILPFQKSRFLGLLRLIKPRLWGAVSLSIIGVYGALIWISHNATPYAQGTTASASLVERLQAMPAYLFTLLGFPFCTDLQYMQVCGVTILLFYLAVIAFFFFQRPLCEYSPASRAAISIFLFGLSAIALITYGRCDRGYLEATATRYVQFSELMLTGAYLFICFSQFKQRLTRNLLLAAFLCVIGITTGLGYAQADFNGTFWRNLQLRKAYILRTYKIQSNTELATLQSNPFFVKTQAATLERLKLNVFSRPHTELEQVPKIAGEPSYCLDKTSADKTTATKSVTPSMAIAQNSDKSISLSGWAFDRDSKRPAKRVALIVDDHLIIPAGNGLRYPGVAESFHAKELADCGFYASFSPAILSPGKHTIRLAVEATNGQSMAESKPLLNVDITGVDITGAGL